MSVNMSILKSEEDFLEKIKFHKNKVLDGELKIFLQEVYESKLYYQYYSKFIGAHYQTVIEQFTRLSKDPKAKSAQLRAALEIACSDIHELFIQLEDFKQDEDYNSIKNDDLEKDFLNQNFKIRGWLIFNALLASTAIAILIFK